MKEASKLELAQALLTKAHTLSVQITELQRLRHIVGTLHDDLTSGHVRAEAEVIRAVGGRETPYWQTLGPDHLEAVLPLLLSRLPDGWTKSHKAQLVTHPTGICPTLKGTRVHETYTLHIESTRLVKREQHE